MPFNPDDIEDNEAEARRIRKLDRADVIKEYIDQCARHELESLLFDYMFDDDVCIPTEELQEEMIANI